MATRRSSRSSTGSPRGLSPPGPSYTVRCFLGVQPRSQGFQYLVDWEAYGPEKPQWVRHGTSWIQHSSVTSIAATPVNLVRSQGLSQPDVWLIVHLRPSQSVSCLIPAWLTTSIPCLSSSAGFQTAPETLKSWGERTMGREDGETSRRR
ncbi:uncharacterized protein AB9W97_006166 isoform 2-T2 [Spinachia spinachia]